MLTAPLPTVEINPSDTPLAVVIWLHGLGADGHDFEPLPAQLQLPEQLPIRFVFPHAPEMPVTAFAGQRTRAWFDFDPGGGADLPGLRRSERRIRELIQNEIDDGIASERILLAGFSQGGVLALQTALHHPKPLAGVLALSTFLADGASLQRQGTGSNADIPILMCHGQRDPVLPMALGRASYNTLQDAGYDVQWRDYPMGHEVCASEIRDISHWLQRVLGPADQ